MFICHSDTMLLAAVGGLSGAVSICTDASRLASIRICPSSASITSGAMTKISGTPSAGEPPTAGIFSDATIGKPSNVPTVLLTVGKTCCPSEFCISDSDNACDCPMIQTPPVVGRLAFANTWNNDLTSARNAAAVVPLAVIAVEPLVIDAGETLVISATA